MAQHLCQADEDGLVSMHISIRGLVAVGILVALGVFLVLRALPSLSQAAPAAQAELSAYQVLERQWEDAFDRSPDGAYAEFLRIGRTLEYKDAHTLSHIIGEILYNRSGLAGLSVCTPHFGFGCYHGFAGKFVEERGVGAVNEFVTACKGPPHDSYCEHGIGHGLLAYLGDSKLTEALQLCPSGRSGSVGGCYNGVFMEYFVNNLRRESGGSVRPLDSALPEGSCSTISEKFRPACYYELPAWWRLSWFLSGATFDEQFKKIGQWCAAVADAHLRAICFQGAGAQVAPFSEYDTARIQKTCSLMPTSGSDVCLAEALNAVAQMNIGP